jgi:hypothetical protein
MRPTLAALAYSGGTLGRGRLAAKGGKPPGDGGTPLGASPGPSGDLRNGEGLRSRSKNGRTIIL